MKNLILFAALLCCTTSLWSQACSELFISEYAEGSSNNKALEIYNPTGDTVDLSDYSIVRYRNGLGVAGTPTFLGGDLLPYMTYVVVIDKRDSLGTGNEAPVSDSLQAKADTFVTPNYDGGVHAMYMNGNDAMALRKHDGSTVTLIDLIGKQDQPVDNAWSSCPPYTGAGLWLTANKNLVRRDTIQEGVKSNPASEFDGTAEWRIFNSNTVTSLGCHECSCDSLASTRGCTYGDEVIPNPCTTSILEIEDGLSLLVFPNPSNGKVSVKGGRNIVSVEVYNLQGAKVADHVNGFPNTTLEFEADFPAGIYQLRVTLDKGDAYIMELVRN